MQGDCKDCFINEVHESFSTVDSAQWNVNQIQILMPNISKTLIKWQLFLRIGWLIGLSNS